jgi:predicted dithiol-disulfide oxidoreductase (DUF899 family)
MSSAVDAELASLYKEFLDTRQRIVDLLRSRGSVLTKDYHFVQGDASVSLDDLFQGREDLIVIHNMGQGCSYCTLWADGLNGVLPHLENRASIVLMNGDTPAVQRDVAASRGWKFRMVQDADGSFTSDMGFAETHDGKRHLAPGYSTFHRAEDGTISRVAFDMFGPGDTYMPVFHMLPLLQNGDNGWTPKKSYA